MSRQILHTENLTKRFGSVIAVNKVNFQLQEGEVHAIVGANGAGKSTFVKLLFGELQPTSGKIFVSGTEQKFHSPKAALDLGLSMVSQDFGLIDTMSIVDNLSLTNAHKTNSTFFHNGKQKEIAKSVLENLSLSIDVETLVNELSVSEKQILAIGKSTSSDGDIYIFDEPTSVLSSAAFQTVKQKISELKSKGKSIIYITHKLDEVFELADSVSVFKDGRIAFQSQVKGISKSELLKYFQVMPSENFSSLPLDSSQPLLQVENFSTRSLKNISFTILKGEVVGIIADNERDATNLVKSIYGLEVSQSGHVKVRGEVFKNSPSENVKNKIGLIPDDRRTEGIFNNLSVSDNISLMQLKKTAKAGFIDKGSVAKNAEEKIRELGIKCDSENQLAVELSGGNQQKVLFARWMSYDFDLMILIEPTAGIDLGGKSEIHSIIAKLKKQGKSFLIVSSDNDEVKSISDRLVFLNGNNKIVSSN
jgi:ABC-type sugar transport system ATPase subunit